MTVLLGGFIAVVAALVAFGVAPAVRVWALRVGAVDLPEARRLHAQPVARLGGVAVTVAATVAFAAAALVNPTLGQVVIGPGGPLRWGVIAAAVLVVFLIGALDDLRSVRPRTKLLFELTAALAVVAMVPLPTALSLVPGGPSIELGPVFTPILAALWIATVTNALNMTDVADGVAGGLAAIAALALAGVTLALGKVVAPAVLMALAGGLVGFLPHNFRRRLFLGDSGSLVTGFLLGSASIVGLTDGGVIAVLPAALALGAIVGELVLTLTRRGLGALELAEDAAGRRALRWSRPGFFVPDRRHVPHRLLDRGLSHERMLGGVWGFGAVGGALAVTTMDRPWTGLGAGMACFAFVVLVATRLYGEGPGKTVEDGARRQERVGDGDGRRKTVGEGPARARTGEEGRERWGRRAETVRET